jgi:hypothetical protein
LGTRRSKSALFLRGLKTNEDTVIRAWFGNESLKDVPQGLKPS